MPAFATALKEGSKFRLVYEVVRDMKNALNHAQYNELMENPVHYAILFTPVWLYAPAKKMANALHDGDGMAA